MIDHYLQNNMNDVDYAIHVKALDVLAKGCAQATHTQPVTSEAK